MMMMQMQVGVHLGMMITHLKNFCQENRTLILVLYWQWGRILNLG